MARRVEEPAGRRVDLWWVAVLTVAVVATGMAYTELWNPVVHRLGYPLIPADFSQTLKDALVIGRGQLLHVYSDHAQLVTLPGYALLLAPVATAVHVLHLQQPWLLAGPFCLGTAAAGLAGMDRLACALGVEPLHRRWLLAAGAVALWPTVALWGHPEDVLAVGSCAFCLAAAIERRWRAAGWFLGAALAAQLLAVLIVPVVLAAAGRDRWRPVALRAAALPAALAGAVLVADFNTAWAALTSQPNYPLVDHPTPWMLLSPSLGQGTVAAGPARVIGFVVAAACGVAVRGRPFRPGPAPDRPAGRLTTPAVDPARLVWLAAAAFSARCLFEAVMDPYYVMPAVVLTLVLAAREGESRRAVAVLAGLALTVDTSETFGMWTYWLFMAGLLGVALAAVAPRRQAVARRSGRRRCAPGVLNP